MSLYHVVVFVHVISAMVLVGSSLFAPLLGAALRRTRSVESLREWAVYFQRVGKVAGASAPVVLLTGLYLAFAGSWWGSGWLEASLLLFIAAGALAIAGLAKIAARLVEAAEAAPGGAIPPALDVLRHDPKAATIESYLLGIDVAIVFLMTTKPGSVGAGVTVAAALAVGAAHAARERRHVPATATV